jgi:hypothetical protein
MPARRLLVRKIREVLRLKHERGLSHRAIAQACAIGVGTVTLYLQRTSQLGLGWPLPAELDDAALEARLFHRPVPVRERVRPDCAYIYRELKRDGVTLQLLWEEVRPGPSERLPLHAVLRALPAMGAAAAAVDAAGPPRRREDVHRLLGETSGAGRPAHRRIATRRAVRRRARRQQPHLPARGRSLFAKLACSGSLAMSD